MNTSSIIEGRLRHRHLFDCVTGPSIKCRSMIPRWNMLFRRRKLRNVFISLLSFVLIPFIYFQLTLPVHYVFRNNAIHSKCVIPEVDPYDVSIMKFVWDPGPLICDTIPSLMFVDSSGLLQFNLSSISYYGVDISKLKCEYRISNRHIDDNHVTFSLPVSFTPPVSVAADFFSVTCRNPEGNVVFQRLLTNVALPNATNTRKQIKSESENHLSIVLFGIDSVSRSCAIRKLPKTFKYLTETLEAYDFKGHMKVGENTLPNLLPLLTGRRVWTAELPLIDYAKEAYDSFPFIWKNFSESGYVTMYAEDMADLSTFNYLTRGFINPPTDHYMRPFWLGLSQSSLVQSKLSYVLRFLENKNINLQTSSSMCYGDKPHHVIQIDYLKQFIHRYAGKRKFALSLMNEIAHEYPNFLSFGDDDFSQFLRWMHLEGHLNRTVLVFFSDHGARIDEIRNTFVGRIEEKMPFVSIYIPQHIREKFVGLDENMKFNTERLSTNFDIFQTMIDIQQGNFENPTNFNVDGQLRGISLFGKLPESRSCADAWIPENYCACYSSTPVNTSTNQIVREAANEIVRNLNNHLHSEPKCAQLTLFSILEAHQISLGLEHTDTRNTGISLFQFFKPEVKVSQRYLVVIETIPGHAVFEATLDFGPNQNGKLVGEIVRANKYGHQPDCIFDKRLRPFCYCTGTAQ